jgi:integrase
VTGLRWAKVDTDAGTLTITGQIVPDPKDSKVPSDRPTKRPVSKSTLGLHPAIVAVLKRRKAQQAEDRLPMGEGWPTTGGAADLVFTWADGMPIHPKTLSRIIGRLSVEAGLPRLTAHGLHHSFATAALAARVPVEHVYPWRLSLHELATRRAWCRRPTNAQFRPTTPAPRN